MYDAIVIGAGPCGCIAAHTLAKGGLKVLLYEKSKLPRYKSCSGILIEKSLHFIEQRLGCSIPDSATCTPVQNRGMIFTDDSGREYRFESRGLNIMRDKFDFFLAQAAKEAGAETRDESAVTSVIEEGDEVVVTASGMRTRARFVIDCSGAVGIGGKTAPNVTTYQTYNDGTINLDPHYFYAYLEPELSGYDAWFNVKDGMLVLGVASRGSKDLLSYYDRFVSYMQEKHCLNLREQIKTDKWLIRDINPPFHIDHGSGAILKAGENAGFLNPMGEGISCAMESGYYAALAILTGYENKKNVIAHYKRNVSELQTYMKRQWQLVGRISKKFSFMYC